MLCLKIDGMKLKGQCDRKKTYPNLIFSINIFVTVNLTYHVLGIIELKF